MDELVGELEDDPAENLRIMLSQVKSRVVELEAQLSDAAGRSSRELEQHVKLLWFILGSFIASNIHAALLFVRLRHIEGQNHQN